MLTSVLAQIHVTDLLSVVAECFRLALYIVAAANQLSQHWFPRSECSTAVEVPEDPPTQDGDNVLNQSLREAPDFLSAAEAGFSLFGGDMRFLNLSEELTGLLIIEFAIQ